MPRGGFVHRQAGSRRQQRVPAKSKAAGGSRWSPRLEGTRGCRVAWGHACRRWRRAGRLHYGDTWCIPASGWVQGDVISAVLLWKHQMVLGRGWKTWGQGQGIRATISALLHASSPASRSGPAKSSGKRPKCRVG